MRFSAHFVTKVAFTMETDVLVCHLQSVGRELVLEGAEITLGGEEGGHNCLLTATRRAGPCLKAVSAGQVPRLIRQHHTCASHTVTGAALSIFRAQRIQLFTSEAPHSCLRNILGREQEPGRPFFCFKHVLRLWNCMKLSWLAECWTQHGTGQGAGFQVCFPSLSVWPGTVPCNSLLWALRQVCPWRRSAAMPHLELNLGKHTQVPITSFLCRTDLTVTFCSHHCHFIWTGARPYSEIALENHPKPPRLVPQGRKDSYRDNTYFVSHCLILHLSWGEEAKFQAVLCAVGV